ncbi:MAG: LAGLIDADG family homing endonuclease [Patescibacteria group bacterium]
MGSRSKTDLAYIAGFLDGDGSLMLQIKKRSDTKRAVRFMVTICLYQDTRHEKSLYWMRDALGIGYISRRNDGISELRINGYKRVGDILLVLEPYIRFKKVQTKALLKACTVLQKGSMKNLSKLQLGQLVNLILVVQNENYKASRKKNKSELYSLLGLTP